MSTLESNPKSKGIRRTSRPVGEKYSQRLWSRRVATITPVKDARERLITRVGCIVTWAIVDNSNFLETLRQLGSTAAPL